MLCCCERRKNKLKRDKYNLRSVPELEAEKTTVKDKAARDCGFAAAYTVAGLGIVVAAAATGGATAIASIPALAVVGIGIGDKVSSFANEQENIEVIDACITKKNKVTTGTALRRRH